MPAARTPGSLRRGAKERQLTTPPRFESESDRAGWRALRVPQDLGLQLTARVAARLHHRLQADVQVGAQDCRNRAGAGCRSRMGRQERCMKKGRKCSGSCRTKPHHR